MTPGHVLFVHPADEGYGADRILLGLVLGLRDRGWVVAVVLPDDVAPGWLSEQLLGAGVAVERGPLAVARRRYLRPTALPGYAVRLWLARRWVRHAAVRHGADLIHVNTTAILVAAMLGRPHGARVVWHVHEIVLRPRALGWLFRVLPVATADRVVAVSDAVRRWLGPGRRGRGVIVLRNGLPARAAPARAPRSGRDVVVAFVGRLNRWKGYEVFVDAATRVGRGRPGVRFILAGDPPPGEAWRVADLGRRIAEAGLDGRIESLGWVSDGAAVFEAADVAVVPSVWPDPLPTVVLEAMRAGCAVIASDLGGTPEMIEDGRSGVLVPAGDAGALADAIEALLDAPERIEALAAAAQARVAASFEEARAVERLVKVYREVLGHE